MILNKVVSWLGFFCLFQYNIFCCFYLYFEDFLSYIIDLKINICLYTNKIFFLERVKTSFLLCLPKEHFSMDPIIHSSSVLALPSEPT